MKNLSTQVILIKWNNSNIHKTINHIDNEEYINPVCVCECEWREK